MYFAMILAVLTGCQKAANPLIGKWQMRQDVPVRANPVIREFKTEGIEKAVVSLTYGQPGVDEERGSFGIITMTYKVNGNTLFESLQGLQEGKTVEDTSTRTFTIAGNTLTINPTGAGGIDLTRPTDTQTYTRVGWFDRARW